MESIEITIRGKVQGVFFRQSTLQKADSLGIKGIVRNCSDGSVVIVATATKEKLDALVEWCHDGPERAEVTSVESNPMELIKFSSFTIERKSHYE